MISHFDALSVSEGRSNACLHILCVQTVVCIDILCGHAVTSQEVKGQAMKVA